MLAENGNVFVLFSCALAFVHEWSQGVVSTDLNWNRDDNNMMLLWFMMLLVREGLGLISDLAVIDAGI